MKQRPETLDPTEAKSCPFCGEQPTIQPWYSGGLRKRHVGCRNEYCAAMPGVCGSTRGRALAVWNDRLGQHIDSTEDDDA